MFTKKSLVMLGTKNEEEKAVLSLEQKGDMFEGRLRLYNFSSEPRGILSIGFYHNGKVSKAGLSRVSSMLYNFKTDIKNVTENFSCAVVNFSEGDMNPILYGNTEGNENKVTKLGKVMSEVFEEKKSASEVEEILDQKNIDYSEEYKAEIEAEIDKNLCNDCANCKYKKAFFDRTNVENLSVASNLKKVNSNTEEAEPEQEKTFFNEIKGQIDSLFAKNSREEFLEDIIPNSKWVKVDYADDGDYYILGLIYEDEVLKYIVYGVPGVYQKNPPKEIAGYPVWFPLDKERRESFGYWLSYQDAETGESIKAVVE